MERRARKETGQGTCSRPWPGGDSGVENLKMERTCGDAEETIPESRSRTCKSLKHRWTSGPGGSGAGGHGVTRVSRKEVWVGLGRGG